MSKKPADGTPPLTTITNPGTFSIAMGGICTTAAQEQQMFADLKAFVTKYKPAISQALWDSALAGRHFIREEVN